MKPKVLIIGLGKIGMMYNFYNKKIKYNNHSDAFFDNKNFQLIGGVELNKERRKLFRKKYKLPCYSNLKVAYKKCKPDILVLSVSTEKSEHFFECIKENNLRPKLILLEKPGSYEYIKLKFFYNYCKAKKIQLFFNYQRSYSQKLLNFRNFLDYKKIGKLKSINIYYSKGLYNSCSHYLNLLFLLLKTNTIKNLKILDHKKIKKDFLVNFSFQMKYLVNFRVIKNKMPEKIIFNGSKINVIYLTELSKIYYYIGKKKYLINNDFNTQQLNVLKKINQLIGTGVNFNITNNLKTLKFLNSVTKDL